MNFLDLVNMRHSVRNYETRAVETEKLDYVLECVRLSPSAVNFQPWKFAVVTDEARLLQLKKLTPETGWKMCPALSWLVPIMRNPGIASRTEKTMQMLMWL